jgi:hypothetical protein
MQAAQALWGEHGVQSELIGLKVGGGGGILD